MLSFYLLKELGLTRRLRRGLVGAGVLVGLAAPAWAQVGYRAADAQALTGSYTDLGATGTAVAMANP
ncbi:MAG TPA: hypothetical protein VEI97_21025, partial [bacterium]|nr:hypothetical protein [bacterium]